MYLALDTIYIWEISFSLNYGRLFDALRNLLQDDDFLVVGCYSPSPEVIEKISSIHFVPKGPKPFVESFDLNRSEYPKGRSFCFPASEENFALLARLEDEGDGLRGGIDDIIAFRKSIPVLPLVYFHNVGRDALYLSGHYRKSEVLKFSEDLEASFRRIVSPRVNERNK